MSEPVVVQLGAVDLVEVLAWSSLASALMALWFYDLLRWLWRSSYRWKWPRRLAMRLRRWHGRGVLRD